MLIRARMKKKQLVDGGLVAVMGGLLIQLTSLGVK